MARAAGDTLTVTLTTAGELGAALQTANGSSDVYTGVTVVDITCDVNPDADDW